MDKKLILVVLLAGCSPGVTEAELAHVYACGFQHGQRMTMKAARLSPPAPQLVIECEGYADNAIAHGFTVANKR
jgi:hypothetical protein